MGDSSHPLVREVHYRRDGTGVIYFEPVHIQWMPMQRPYLDVIEVSLGQSNGNLVSFGDSGIKSRNTLQRKKGDTSCEGSGVTEELIKIASHVLLNSLQSGFHAAASGKSLCMAEQVIGQSLKRGLKRKAGNETNALKNQSGQCSTVTT